MKTASEALEQVKDISGRITAINNLLALESEGVLEEWEGLKAAGGGRDNHAAELLKRLRPHLADLKAFATLCESQLEARISDPFGMEREGHKSTCKFNGENEWFGAPNPSNPDNEYICDGCGAIIKAE